MKVFVKTMEDGRIIEAPKVYKNISNFNKSKKLMEKFGFVEHIKAYSKNTGEIKYVTPEKWRYNKAYYTEIPYQGVDYEWNSDKEQWILKLDIAKERKMELIRNATNAYMDMLKKNFSNAEMETWARQENGLNILMDDPASLEYDAVWVRNLAEARGISLEEQLQRISYATTYMNNIAYQLVGYQQRLEDMITAATSVDELENINFEIEGGISNE